MTLLSVVSVCTGLKPRCIGREASTEAALEPGQAIILHSYRAPPMTVTALACLAAIAADQPRKIGMVYMSYLLSGNRNALV